MGVLALAADAPVALTDVISNFGEVLTAAGTGVLGFVEKVVASPVLLLTCVLMPIALTLGSFAIGMLRR